jgi:hypothetical protein
MRCGTTIVPKRLNLALINLSGDVDEYLEHFFSQDLQYGGGHAADAVNRQPVARSAPQGRETVELAKR